MALGKFNSNALEEMLPDSNGVAMGNSEMQEDGSVMVNLPSNNEEDPEIEKSEYSEETHLDNLAEELEKTAEGRECLASIGRLVLDNYKSDLASNEEHFATLTKGFGMLGTKIEQGTLFDGACGVYHPLMMESAVKFQQKASLEILPSGGPVKVEIIGAPTMESEAQASRVLDHMNWQTTVQIPEYYPEKERMLFYLPLVGSAITKLYYNQRLERPDSFFVPVDRFIVPYGATSLEKAPRYTEIIPMSKQDYKKEVLAGLYREEDLGEPGMIKLTELQQKTDEFIGVAPTNSKTDGAYTFLEQHVDLSLEGIDEEPDFDKPYIVTIEEGTSKVLSIYRNWDYGDSTYTKNLWYVHYPFVPGIGFYGLGYIHLLGNIQMTLTVALRSLIDAGQFANLPAGFKQKGLRVAKDQGPLKPGEFRDLEYLGDDISKVFTQLPFKGPDSTLFQLLSYLDAKGGAFADSTEQVAQNASNYGPVGTTMALLDASTKFFTAVHKRLHFAQKKELAILAKLNMKYLDDEFSFDVPGQTLKVFRNDYSSKISIEPVSDPNVSSAAQRFALAQAKLQFVQSLPPQMSSSINTKPIIMSALAALGQNHLEQIMPPEEMAQPMDPLGDIEALINGKPIQAYPGQAHEAHIQFKSAWLNDPTQGMNPVFQAFVPRVQSNIQQHTLLKYQEQIKGIVNQTMQQQQIQLTGAATDQQTIAMVEAQAAEQVNQANQQIQNGQQNQTPEQILAQAELIKAQANVAKVNADVARDQAKIEIEEQKLQLDASKELNRKQEANAKIVSDNTKERMKVGAGMANDAAERISKFTTEQMKTETAVKIAKTRKVKAQSD